MGNAAWQVPEWLDVSRETVAKLQDFLELVIKWNPRINLISGPSVANAWVRHVLDSAQLWQLSGVRSGLWLDLGSGAGFPGLVIAVLAQQAAPDLRVILVESDRRKSVFLSEVVRQLQVPAEITCARIESLRPLDATIVSARALAPLIDLLPLIARHTRPTGLSLLHKGQRYQAELAEASKTWAMQVEVIESKIDPDGVILKIRDLHHV